MARKVIESLITWSRTTRPKQQARRRAGTQWVKPKLSVPTKVVKWVPPHADMNECRVEPSRTPKHEWVILEARNLSGGPKKAGADAVASCQVVRFDGAEAECVVKLLGFEMPSVSLPAWVLRANNLKEGDRFYWIMRDSDHISPADIDTNVPRSAATAQMSAAERAELADLYADSRRREREGEGWEEYTGDGR